MHNEIMKQENPLQLTFKSFFISFISDFAKATCNILTVFDTWKWHRKFVSKLELNYLYDAQLSHIHIHLLVSKRRENLVFVNSDSSKSLPSKPKPHSKPWNINLIFMQQPFILYKEYHYYLWGVKRTHNTIFNWFSCSNVFFCIFLDPQNNSKYTTKMWKRNIFVYIKFCFIESKNNWNSVHSRHQNKSYISC